MKLNNELYKVHHIENFKDMIDKTVEKYPNNVAYKFKKNLGKENETIIEKTYSEINKEIEGFATSLLNLGLKDKKVVIIANNRYEWCVSYLAITTSSMIVVPLDKMLPEGEINNLITRSKADAVIFENKYSEIFNRIRESGENENLKIFINMDN